MSLQARTRRKTVLQLESLDERAVPAVFSPWGANSLYQPALFNVSFPNPYANVFYTNPLYHYQFDTNPFFPGGGSSPILTRWNATPTQQYQQFTTALNRINTQIQSQIAALNTAVQSNANFASSVLTTQLNQYANNFVNSVDTTGEPISVDLSRLQQTFNTIVQTGQRDLVSRVNALQRQVSYSLGQLSRNFGRLGAPYTTAINDLRTSAFDTISQLRTDVSDANTTMTSTFNDAIDQFQTVFSNAFDTFDPALGSDPFTTDFGTALDDFQSNVTANLDAVNATFGTSLDDYNTSFNTVFDQFSTDFNDLYGPIGAGSAMTP